MATGMMRSTTETGSISRRKLLKNAAMAAAALPALAPLPPQTIAEVSGVTGSDDHQYWISLMSRVGGPVLHALSERRLKEQMPVEAAPGFEQDRRQYSHLEAMGRLLAGMAPWLESGSVGGEEGKLRNQYAEWARAGIQAGTDPKSPDFMNFNKGGQPVVDAAFLALAILRAPTELWKKLDATTQRNLVAALESTRVIQPGYSNWLLFPATIEAALSMMGVWWDPMRVDYAVRSLDSWYKGDGVYGDGPEFHWDYYNSFVIHPMLLAVLDTVSKTSPSWDRFRKPALERAGRYAAIQERMIAPDASFPPIGRSLGYRFGAFHLLADMALRKNLPEGVHPAQVRSVLTAVMRRMAEAPGTFDENGWLQIGFSGHQPSIAESYISTGSCYLCSAAWLPLGLNANDPFWAAESMPWTSKRVWNGEAVRADHALTPAEKA
ncbi:DUF2264 domain-containing protein [Acidicapsa dinghuensis]|uniref:DUF2264 domain-containing protein n=1 Tax=Acidicapsa dinghuensis TaxID=2218256 RepID=A0ABW1EF45_9BACT|nr:DUF2264 domain-containing protein [Acidicapsa dinghuensis]